MGGKTQPRVAGNVKPSSSGRIRELLVNKHGGGNIITFSTLASNNKQPQVKEANPAPADNKTREEPRAETPSQPSPSGKPTLVVKKVGNRDCFVRVRVPKEAISREEEQPTKPEVSANIDEGRDKSGEDQLKVDNVHDKIEDETSAKHEEPTYNFDSLIEELAKIQESNQRRFRQKTLEELTEDELIEENELVRLLMILSTRFTDELSLEEWDLVNRSIYKWGQLITKVDTLKSENSSKRDFCIKVLNFIHQLMMLANSLKVEPQENTDDRSPLIQSLLNDWDNFYSTNLYQDLIVLFFKLAQIEKPTRQDSALIKALGEIVVDVDPKLILDKLPEQINSRVEIDQDFHLPENTRYCDFDESKFRGFLAVANLLTSHHRVVLITAHSMLSKMIGTVCDKIQATPIINEEDDIDNLSIVPPLCLMSLLTSRDSLMSALLSDYQVGDISVTIDPTSDSYSCTLAYLFVWDIVIKFIVGLEKEVGHCIIGCFKKLGLIRRLLDNIFMLVPPLDERDSLNFAVEAYDEDASQIEPSHGSITRDRPKYLSNFLKSPLKLTLQRLVNEIELTALHVYFSVALHMPVTVRKWYNNNANKKLCNLVNEYTVKHISNIICSLEMENVHEKCQVRVDEDKMNNLVIKARPNAREVYAIYTRRVSDGDEFKMELTIKLPPNYPLGSVQIDGGKRMGVTDLKWRSWLLQLTTFLAHQNGPILDGVDLWKRNIDKRFEGIEKCMICFSILHSNYQLPRKRCQTCSQIFHNSCLYKWFATSGNSTCPLCRNIW